MKNYKIFLIFLLIWKGSSIFAMDYLPDLLPFRHDHELSNTGITSITQDTTGQIWLTTSSHLYNYNGYQINKIVLPSHPAITTLSEIQYVYGASDNKIWLGLSNGICCYDQNQKTFRYYFPVPEDMLNMGNIVYKIAENSTGDLYFATRNGIFKLIPAADSLKRVENFPWHKVCSGNQKHERIVKALHITHDNILWSGTEGDGLWHINLKDGNKFHFQHTQNSPNSLGGNVIYSIFEDHFGVIWIGTENGLSAFIKETSTFSNIRLNPSLPVLSICETQEANLILGTPDGLYLYNRKTQNSRRIDLTSYPSLVNSSNIIPVIKRDRSGGIWIGTPKGLVRYYAPHDFALLKHSDQNINSISSDEIHLLVSDPKKEGIWIGSRKGTIDFYKPSTQTFKHYQLPSGYYRIPLTGYINNNGELLLGTMGGLIRYNANQDCFEPWNFSYTDQNFSNTYAILQDRHGHYWLGVLDSGLYHIDPDKQTCKRIPISYEKIYKNIYTNIKILYEDRQDYLWIVFWRAGIMRYNPNTGEEKLFTSENTDGKLPNNTIWSVKEDPMNRIILATAGGVVIWDPAQEQFVDSTLVAPLREESIVGMERKDNDSTWWLSTTKGIIRMAPYNGNILHYTEADGLQDNVFNYQAIAQLDSFMFFGGNYGLNVINPRTTFKNNYIPVPHLTQIILNGRELNPDNLPLKNGLPYLSLNKGDKVEIFFSSFSFRREWRNRYKYCFTKHTPETWSLPIAQNKVEFTAIKRSQTVFHLTASNSEGFWSRPKPMLLLETNTPWQQVTFIAIGILLLIGTSIHFLKNTKSKIKAGQPKQTGKIPTQQTDSQTLLLRKKLETLMEEEKLWKNKRFSKAELGGRLKLNEQQLTLFLKNNYNKSFPELINEYRVEAVKTKMQDPKNRDYTLFALGEECGFNSRSSFYRVFKECTGQTPAEYQEQLTKEGSHKA